MMTTSNAISDLTRRVPHDFAARWAVRQLVAARSARDSELAELYAALLTAHLDRHLAGLRRLP